MLRRLVIFRELEEKCSIDGEWRYLLFFDGNMEEGVRCWLFLRYGLLSPRGFRLCYYLLDLTFFDT